MKKNKLWILLIIFIGLFVFKVDGVFATDPNTLYFFGCENYVEEVPSDGTYITSEAPNLLHCSDPGFAGWKARLSWGINFSTYYCEKNGKFVEAKDNPYNDNNSCFDENGSDHVYLFNDKVPTGFNPNGANVNLFAVFVPTFTIQYEGCSNLSGQTQNITIGESTATKKCTDPGVLGWHVEVVDKGWYCLSDDGKKPQNCDSQGKKIYSNGASVKQTGENGDTVIFHAVTSSNAEKFTIKYEDGVNGKVEGQMEDQEVVIGISTNLNKNNFKRENYKFAGWTVRVVHADGTSGYYCANDNVLSSIDDCNDNHGGLKKYSDGAEVSQTGTVGSTVYMKATWEVSIGSDTECLAHTDRDSCQNTGLCTWNSEYNFCNIDGLAYLTCGDAKDIPQVAPKLTSYAVTLLKTVAPIVLIIISIIQLVKAITAGKEDEIKKAQGSLIKKGIAAVIIFFVITIVQFIMLKVADSSEKDNLSSCLSCFLNGTGDSKCGKVYFKDGYGKCYYTSDKNKGISCDNIK